MIKAVFIVGPTAVGKTKLAFYIANKFNGDLVSADSVQVYKGLDIISGKDLPPDYKLHAGYYSGDNGASIHLLDVVEPTSSFSVSDFYHFASKVIEEIHTKGKIPIIVGGTGLYISVLLNGLDTLPPPNAKLRDTLDKLSVDELHKLLPVETVKVLNGSEKNNKRRLIRKIEIHSYNKNLQEKKKLPLKYLVIGLHCKRESLKKRIDERVHERIQKGSFQEAEKLFRNYKNLASQVRNANGYKQLFEHLNKKLTRDEAIEKWRISEYRHAKNQMTWFKKYGQVEWYDLENEKTPDTIFKRISTFLL